MDETKVICECGHSAEKHSYDDGCDWSEYKTIYKYCGCRKNKEELVIEYLEKRIFSLETDVIHARRVAEERQEIITSLAYSFQKIIDGCYDVDLVIKTSNDAINKVLHG